MDVESDIDFYTKTEPRHLIANSSRYLSEVFHGKSFIVNDKQQYFGNKETFKHLSMNFWDNGYSFQKIIRK